MFWLKKIVSAFLLPIPIGLFLLFIALVYLLFNSYKKAKIYLFFSFLWFVLISFLPVSNALLSPLEKSHKALLDTPKVDYIVVLGSGHKSDESLSITSEVKPIGINRLVEGIRHYKNLENSKLIVLGYKGKDKNSHAFMQEKLALSLGVKKQDIIKFEMPKDTRMEALEVKKLLKNEKFILVTSASHMKRAILLFKKVGLNPIASPTNHLAYETKVYKQKFSSQNIYKIEVAFHEYLGLAWAWLRGFI